MVQEHCSVLPSQTRAHQAVLQDERGASTWEGTTPGPKSQVQLLGFRGPSFMTPIQNC